ncbi:methylglyoxal reductase (NADPH-dependent) gre2 [Neurospora sp. IMI 360204]|nr:methylglyoxal reductase (NADPH-dependent) gre2 [Neurospora sp. IMI 360204]
MPMLGGIPGHPKSKVLLTGGTGFIASHILDHLLECGFDVVVTARSHAKGERILASIDNAPNVVNTIGCQVTYAVVDNIAQPGAFDEVIKTNLPLHYCIHTASPYQLSFSDPVNDCLRPAINGTLFLLTSLQQHAPSSLLRVVFTSSSAAILNPPNHRPVYDESSWPDDETLNWDLAKDPSAPGDTTYRASKKFAEQAVWNFMEKHHPSWDLATINNTYTFGPLPRSLDVKNDGQFRVNTSNERIIDCLTGKWSQGIPPTAPVFTFVDVRDVAIAHVRAMTRPEAGGKRFYVVGGFFSNPNIAGVVHGLRKAKQQGREVRNGKEVEMCQQCVKFDDFPENHWMFDNTRSKKMLGLEYRRLEESVVDTVRSLREMGVGKGNPQIAGHWDYNEGTLPN